MKRAAHEENIRPHWPGEVQRNEPKSLQAVDGPLNLPVQAEPEDRVPVELDRDLADGTEPSRVGRCKHLDLGPFDVNL